MPSKQHYSSTGSTPGSFNASASEGGSSLQMVLPISGNIEESGLLESRTLSVATTAAEEDEMTPEGQQVFAESVNNEQLTETAEFESEEEDEMCPICLLEIVEGEDLVECAKGCHIELHRHCMEICKETIVYSSLGSNTLSSTLYLKIVFKY